MTGFFSGFASDGKILIINSTQQKKKPEKKPVIA
jgi:hypothetical protein